MASGPRPLSAQRRPPPDTAGRPAAAAMGGSPAAAAPSPRGGGAAGRAPIAGPGDLLRRSDLPWAGALAGSLALAVTGPGLDEDVARETEADPGGLAGAVADGGDVAGSVWLDYGAAGGTLAVAELAGWPEAGRVALRALASLAVTDAATLGLKVAFGRGRPADGPPGSGRPDADRFDAFRWDEEHRSLPSGHTARLFALASTLDRELGDRAPWLPWVAYPAAALTGAGRVLEREHWVTDVLSGAALGLLTSRVAGRIPLPGSDARRSVRVFAATAGSRRLVGLRVAAP